MTTTPNSPAMEALDYIAENFSEDVPVDVYEKAEACYDTIRDHIAKLEAEDAILHAANAEFSQAAIESHAEVLRLRNELEAARKALSPLVDLWAFVDANDADDEKYNFILKAGHIRAANAAALSAPTGVKTGGGG